MASSNNMISLYGCIDANGYPIPYNNPLLQDITPANLVAVLLENVTNWEGNSVPCFKLFYASPKSLSYSYFFLPVTDALPTLTQFLADLQGLSAANMFSLYTNLQAINDAPQSVQTNGFIANDDLTMSRVYNPGSDNTDVYLCIVNDLQYDKFTVDSDQTTAGGYSYFS